MAEKEALGSFEEALREIGRGLDLTLEWIVNVLATIPEETIRADLKRRGFSDEYIENVFKQLEFLGKPPKKEDEKQ